MTTTDFKKMISTESNFIIYFS